METMERAQFEAELHAKTEGEEGTFKGFASVFNKTVDAWIPTVIHKGAFKKTLRQRQHKVKILYQHNTRMPIGVPISLKETKEGLEIVGKISDTADGRDALTLMRDGVIDELSIGFDPIKWEMEKKRTGRDVKMTRHIHEAKLWEVSLVTFAAQPEAKINEVHEEDRLAEIERLKDESESEEELAVLPYQNLPLADIKRSWAAREAEGRVRAWAGGKEKISDMDWTKYKKAFVWYDKDDAEKVGSYKLLIADIIDGKLTAVPRGIFASAVVVGGGRSGLKVPSSELPAIRTHLGKYYKKLDRTPPWERDNDPLAELVEEFASEITVDSENPEQHEGRTLSANTKSAIRKAIKALQSLVGDADTPPAKKKEEKQGIDRSESPLENDGASDAERLNKLREAKLLHSRSVNKVDS